MNRWTTVLGGSLLLLSLATAQEAEAQARFGVAGGVSFPMGEIGEEFDTGFHLGGIFETRLQALPFPLRAELGFQRFTHDDDKLTHLTAVLNAVFPVGDRAYLLGGLGLYNTKEESDHGDHSHDDAENLLGFNVGVGFQLPVGGLNLSVESRFHNVLDPDHGGQRFIPLSVAIRF
jgi:hypothetical protein